MHVLALRIVEHLEASFDAFETVLGPLGRKTEDILGLVLWHWLFHDLAWYDLEELERHVARFAEVGEDHLRMGHRATICLLEVPLLNRSGRCRRQ